MEEAHEEANALMAHLANGQQAPQLPPITTLLEVDIDADSTQMQPGVAGSSSSSSGGGSGLTGFLGLSGSSGAAGGGFMGGGALAGCGGLGQLGGRAQGAAAGGAGGGSSGASAAEDARNSAQRLIQTLCNSQLPYGYDPEPLVMAFNWNGGGEHAGRPWTPDLPTDSALLLYLFAAFLDAPGQLLTLCERDGLFKVLLMWLQFHLVERQGLVGGRYLNEAALGGLQDVLAPVMIKPTIPQRVFNWWFPANKW
eukprot:gene7375-7585_t